MRELRDRFGVSLSTVLEACRVLEDRGLVEARAQSGHYVRPVSSTPRSEPGASSPAGGARRVDASLAVRLNLGIGAPQEPTLGAAVQGPELMPIAGLNRLLGHVLRHQPEACHSYDAPPGSAALRRAVARRGGDAGIAATADDIVITSGAKEAVYLSHQGGDAGGRHGGHRVAGVLRAAGGAGLARAAGPRDLEPPAPRDQPRRSGAGRAQPTGGRRGPGVELLQSDGVVHDRRGQAPAGRAAGTPRGAADRGRRVRRARVRGPAAQCHQGLRPPRSRPVLRVVQQDAVARATGGLGHPGPLPERGRAVEAGGEPGHGRGPAAGPGRLPRLGRVRPPHPARCGACTGTR